MLRKNIKVSLCLGGGAVLGAFHIGVLKALDELSIEIESISCTSIGSIIGALYASGKDVKEIERLALNIEWKDLYTIAISKLGILTNEKISSFLKKNIGDKNFDQLKIPLFVVATDIKNGNKVVLNKGSVSKSVMASTCVPGIFIPIRIENNLLVDGGIVENVPILTAKEQGSDYIIAVDLNDKHSYKEPTNILEVLLNSFEFLSRSSVKEHEVEADLIIKPNLENFNCISTNQIKSLIDKGYEESLKILKKEFKI